MQEYRCIKYDGVVYYGKHLIITARGCNDNILDKKVISGWITKLVKLIDMVAFGDPVVERFGKGVQTGISGVQLIETSAITMHTNDQAGDMYLDVFSCKTFSEEAVVDFLKKTFGPTTTNYQVLLR
ncbi:MAG: S-adenosylmethionine decarboxylase [Candidatus Omnitrophica bacterium]|nr:S-adenosylmethionine decarboxylase [Candidatus Omnitrophota bacterium]